MSTNVVQNPQSVMAVIQATQPAQIAELDFVREKYIQNYNTCNPGNNGELMYHRQLVHFKQMVQGSEQLRKCDPFSHYACFVTAAVKGYSLDPEDNEVYLIPLKGKATLWVQAGAHVRRLIRTNQIQYADQAKLVYQGDTFEVVNGRVLRHIETFQTETIVAGYIRFVIDEQGNDRFFIYRKSDWESWRKKSQMPNGDNWNCNGQPQPGFLRTKIILHATKEKCWATGMTPINAEVHTDVEIEVEDIPSEVVQNKPQQIAAPQQQFQQAKPVYQQPIQVATPTPAPAFVNDNDFAAPPPPSSNGVSFDDDNF